MSGIYEYDGHKLYGDGREVEPSPPSTEEYRDEIISRMHRRREDALQSDVLRDSAKGDC